MKDGPLLWYLNRATGTVLMLLFTLTVVLGILATYGRAGRGVPRFLTQAFHRNVSLLALILLIGHIATAVIDTYVDIRWWQAFVPWGATYKPIWLELGAVSFDLILLVIATSLARTRFSHRTWLSIHLFGYVAWAVGIVHGFGIGTDSKSSWSVTLTLICVGLVALAGLARVGRLVLPQRAGAGR